MDENDKAAEAKQMLEQAKAAISKGSDDALSKTEATVSLYHELAASDASHNVGLARALKAFYMLLVSKGKKATALEVLQEAVDLYRDLSEQAPKKHMQTFTDLLRTMGSHQASLGDNEKAHSAAEEFASCYRELAQSDFDRYGPTLAESLLVLRRRASATGDKQGELNAAQEAVSLYRRLAETSPDGSQHLLASSLMQLSGINFAVGNAEGALEDVKEAVKLYRICGEDCRLDLASAHDLSASLHAVFGNHDNAIESSRLALEAILPMLQHSPEDYGEEAQDYLDDYLDYCDDAGSRPDADLILRVTMHFR